MSAIVEQLLEIPGGGILYDASQSRKARVDWFERDFWAGRNALTEVAGGRGAVRFLRSDDGRWVWRHYRRGGLMAKLSSDRYLWTGGERTRSFAEWRLLAELRRRELPVPVPVAARYVRSGLTYTADLITQELPASQTLAQVLSSRSVAPWRAIGSTIARFHQHGVQHADLNAHNILIAADETIHLLDFDRGRIRTRGSWEEGVLARLRRSLEKISRQRNDARFDASHWRSLMEGYLGA
jgi:3-deoxy-D-manno-octulosonic acid kinase